MNSAAPMISSGMALGEKEKRELTEYLKRIYKNLSGKDAL